MFGLGVSNKYNFALVLQRIERGEIIDSGYEGFFRVRADGKDEISSLPRNVALRVRLAKKYIKFFCVYRSIKIMFQFC